MSNLLGNIFRSVTRGPATRRYPFERRAAPGGARGRLEMEISTCIFCGLCQRRCPANAIAVAREPKSWTCDPYACILCGACIEACPKDCLRFDKEHRPPAG
jgi:formate hydrogenlyase subunit 6/NADH:ubiquinone oxidoreductase subunit I